MRISDWSSDVCSSDLCGNGSRALARFVRERGLSSKPAIRVRTRTGVLELQHVEGNRYRVDMGVPRLEPADVPFTAAARADRYTLTLEQGADRKSTRLNSSH